MCVIGIVAEYNPFHNGHMYQIKKIREMYPDCKIIAVMSGNIVQRGEFALLSKENRAKAAVMCGVDLVLELPQIFSASSAEIFAFSSVYILNALNIVDYICFGSENGSVESIGEMAEILSSAFFQTEVNNNIRVHKNLSYPKIIDFTYKEMFGEHNNVLNGSNNILALEYIKSLKKLNSNIKPVTIKRKGADYNSLTSVTNSDCMVSASFIREVIRKKNDNCNDLYKYLPEDSYKILLDVINNDGLVDIKVLDCVVLSHLKRLSAEDIRKYPDINGGFEYKILSAVKKSSTLEELYNLTEVKTYSKSRIRRIILYIFFDIIKEDIKKLPQFTNFLAANKAGLQILSSIRKKSNIPIVTKQADFINNKNDGNNLLSKQLQKNIFIDEIYNLTIKDKNSLNNLNKMKKKPFIL